MPFRDLLHDENLRHGANSFTSLLKEGMLRIMYLDNLCNKNQLEALFIVNLFRPTTSTCFGHIYCPSSGGTHSICTAIGMCYTFR
jgi:hypothetical protein